MASVTNKSLPTVSIGLFVYNGDKAIGLAIESYLAQTYSDFELIISDNASNDRTEEICRSYAEQDERIRYVRQKENIGANKNIQFVLQQSKCEFFMWATGDDFRSPGYIEENLKILNENPECAFSSAPNCYEGDEGDLRKQHHFSLEGPLP